MIVVNALFMYVLVVLASMLGFFYIAIPAAILFSYWFDGRWLVVTGVLLDAYYGAFAHVPWFSLVSLGVYLAMVVISPRLRSV